MPDFSEKRPFTAVIITHNAAQTLEACLRQLAKVCDEVLVLDSFSDDGTVELCRGMEGVTLVPQPWLGFSKTKNLGNAMARNNWVLSIDSDEVLSDELLESLCRLQPESGRVYSLDRLTSYCGKWIHHSGWYPDWKPRLFEQDRVSWQGDFVHETLSMPEGWQEVRLQGKLYHYSYSNREDHYRRIDKYAELAARERFEKGLRPGFVKCYLSPLARFFRTYVLNLGFLDGRAGWQISLGGAVMVFRRYRRLRQLWQEKR